jgi:hypothetical protein
MSGMVHPFKSHPRYFGWISFRPLVEFQPRVAYGQRSIDLVGLRQAYESGDSVITVAGYHDKSLYSSNPARGSRLPGLHCEVPGLH